MNTAHVFNFSRPPSRPRYNIGEQLHRAHAAALWLEAQGLEVQGFGGSTLDLPTVMVKACARVYSTFPVRRSRPRYHQDGALRYETWEAIDRVHNVRVQWKEVVACGT